ncbi:MAG: hypothetical protein JRI36_05625 [Deltaproteobacteria bacterium]|nr:hypothetical protein [Deltaproteobacteria bacterium]
MKKVGLVAFLVLVFMACVGMGGLGGPARISVPEPSKDYVATITDQADVTSRVHKLSCEGQTAISGELGSGHVSIGFDKIASIEFVLAGDVIRAHVALKDGKRVTLAVDKAVSWFGKLPYGDFKIATEAIRSIEFH